MPFVLEQFESNEENDIYFQFHCLYNAATELYDRKLTDKRSPYDPTEAFVVGESRPLSIINAKSVYHQCVKGIEHVTHKPFNYQKWRDCVRQYFNVSAQGWIDWVEYLYKDNRINNEILKYVNPFKIKPVKHCTTITKDDILTIIKNELDKFSVENNNM